MPISSTLKALPFIIGCKTLTCKDKGVSHDSSNTVAQYIYRYNKLIWLKALGWYQPEQNMLIQVIPEEMIKHSLELLNSIYFCALQMYG